MTSKKVSNGTHIFCVGLLGDARRGFLMHRYILRVNTAIYARVLYKL